MTQLSILKVEGCCTWMVQHLFLGFQTRSGAVGISVSPCLLPAVVNDQEARRDVACLQAFESLLDACSMSGAQTFQWMWPPGPCCPASAHTAKVNQPSAETVL